MPSAKQRARKYLAVARAAGTRCETAASGSNQTTPFGNCCDARMKNSVSSQPAGRDAVRPSECRKPPIFMTTSRRTDMFAPMRFRTGPGSERWPL